MDFMASRDPSRPGELCLISYQTGAARSPHAPPLVILCPLYVDSPPAEVQQEGAGPWGPSGATELCAASSCGFPCSQSNIRFLRKKNRPSPKRRKQQKGTCFLFERPRLQGPGSQQSPIFPSIIHSSFISAVRGDERGEKRAVPSLPRKERHPGFKPPRLISLSKGNFRNLSTPPSKSRTV